jgi:hypothetical protein
LKVNDENRSIQIQDPNPNPDPLVRGMDPRIRIRIHPKCHGSATLVSGSSRSGKKKERYKKDKRKKIKEK